MSRDKNEGQPIQAMLLAVFVTSLVAGSLTSLRVRAEEAEQVTGRQVTVVGIRAIPGSPSIDPRLSSIAAQLHRIKPGYGFVLLGTESRRLTQTQVLKCPLGDPQSGIILKLDEPQTPQGRVGMSLRLTLSGRDVIDTQLAIQPNQLFLSDVSLPDQTAMLVGIAAR